MEGKAPINRVLLYCTDSLAYKLDLLVRDQLQTDKSDDIFDQRSYLPYSTKLG